MYRILRHLLVLALCQQCSIVVNMLAACSLAMAAVQVICNPPIPDHAMNGLI